MAIDDNTSYELTGYQVKDLANKVRGKADSSSLASVATSGLYSDLTGKPTIPTVNNGTLTIKQNGTTIDTFSANQSTDVTVDLAGGIYADDPTAPANPSAWITGSDIDASQMPGANTPTIITGTVTNTSWTQVGTNTFTPTKDGLFFFEVQASVFFGSSEGSLAVRLYNTSTSSAMRTYGVYSWKNWAGNYAADLMCSSMLYLTTSDTIRVDARTEHTAKSTTPTVWITQIY